MRRGLWRVHWEVGCVVAWGCSEKPRAVLSVELRREPLKMQRELGWRHSNLKIWGRGVLWLHLSCALVHSGCFWQADCMWARMETGKSWYNRTNDRWDVRGGFSSEDAEKGPKSGSVLDTVVTELAVRWALRRRGKQGQLQGFRSEQLSTFY